MNPETKTLFDAVKELYDLKKRDEKDFLLLFLAEKNLEKVMKDLEDSEKSVVSAFKNHT